MILALGPFHLDTQDGLLLRGGEPVTLGRRAIALLRALVEQPGALLSKDALIEAAWSGQSIEDSNLTVQIAALRRVLGMTPGGDRWIETMPRRGYRFIGPVVSEKCAPEKSTPPRLSMVVLPFANIGGDREQDYFVDGITESLTTDLSRIQGAVVIARNTAFTYKGKPVDAKQIGRELNVRYVLEGSVQRGGNRMRVNVQLIDAETGNHLWAERFDKPLADLFDMQDEIVARLANSLDAQLAAAEARRVEPGSGYKFAARVTAEATGSPGATPGEAAAPAPPSPSAPAPERRQLTIMQCAISGPAFEFARRDPEDLHRLLTAFHASCAAVIAESAAPSSSS